MNEECVCHDDTTDFLVNEVDLGRLGKARSGAWICADEGEPAKLFMDFAFDCEDVTMIEEVNHIEISFCPFCGRKLTKKGE